MNAVMLPVVMLPGLDGTGLLSAHFVEAMQARGIQMQVLPMPARGPQDYTTLASILRPQLPASPFVLLADSFAGPLAVELAAAPPPGLRGLVLSTTFARRPVPPLALMARLLLGQWRTRANLRELSLAITQVPAATLRQRAAATLQVDVRALLPELVLPTLCLHAQQDRLLWPPSVAELQVLLPDARHVSLQGPHLLLQARADAAAAEIAAWMRTLSP
ncbi:lysophospholipase [Stenotrophomonas maltophilia]|uniref:alpha/beta fold hydrolase n=1 Tax=Stenotrophomonas maltophilia TaxID=40324 RepID=UPI0031BBC876|nr:lysophospholipase [Stenotrophomonas maltophilia]